MNAISIEALGHSYGQITALANITLKIGKGDIHGLIGPDSAGKTTLMRLLCGLMTIQDGKARINELDVRTSYRQIRSQIGYMPQRFSLYQDLSVQENLLFFSRLFGVEAKERDRRMGELYAFSRLEAFRNRRAGALRGGMKQKLALSCALIHRPELLILDEPTFGVDPLSRQEFWQMLKSIQATGSTILVSTSYMDEAELCDKITLLYSGRILASGLLADIRKDWGRKVFRLKANNVKALFAKLKQSFDTCQLFGNEIHLSVPTSEAKDFTARLATDSGDSSLTMEEIVAGVEDIFLDFMPRGNEAQQSG